jgi:hypothetical protein
MVLSRANDALIARFERTIIEAAGIVAAAQRAAEVDWDPVDAGGNPIVDANGRPIPAIPEDMTPKELRIARDAMNCARNAPLYLTKAYEVQDTAQRLMAAAGQARTPPELAPQFIVVQAAPVYARVPASPEQPLLDESEKK